MWHSLLSYHPRIGFTYTPSVKSRVPFETGGYLVRTNSAGFRSEREFTVQRTPGTFRAILFGDSMTAGDGVANSERYSDLMEKAVPQLEVFNYGLAGGAPDQQYLTFLDCAKVDHDLQIISINVENISRVNARFLTFQDAEGQEVFYAKPYFEIENNSLVLGNVPVPKRPWTKESLPQEETNHVDRGRRVFPKTQALLSQLGLIKSVRSIAKTIGLRDRMQTITKLNRAPEYDSPNSKGWILLRKILTTWISQSQVPVLIVPVPTWSYFEGTSDPTSYQTRFRELATETGCHLHDPLPDLLAHSPEERRSLRFKYDVHFSQQGHQAMARSLAPVVERIMLQRPRAS